jgi:hypothetical protein
MLVVMLARRSQQRDLMRELEVTSHRRIAKRIIAEHLPPLGFGQEYLGQFAVAGAAFEACSIELLF